MSRLGKPDEIKKFTARVSGGRGHSSSEQPDGTHSYFHFRIEDEASGAMVAEVEMTLAQAMEVITNGMITGARGTSYGTHDVIGKKHVTRKLTLPSVTNQLSLTMFFESADWTEWEVDGWWVYSSDHQHNYHRQGPSGYALTVHRYEEVENRNA